MHRIVWTCPAVPNMPKEQADAMSWDSRDMAQLAACLMGGPKSNTGKYRNFRIEETKGHKRG